MGEGDLKPLGEYLASIDGVPPVNPAETPVTEASVAEVEQIEPLITESRAKKMTYDLGQPFAAIIGVDGVDVNAVRNDTRVTALIDKFLADAIRDNNITTYPELDAFIRRTSDSIGVINMAVGSFRKRGGGKVPEPTNKEIDGPNEMIMNSHHGEAVKNIAGEAVLDLVRDIYNLFPHQPEAKLDSENRIQS